MSQYISELTPVDLHFVVSRLPRDIRELIKANPGLVVAGGFIRSTIAGEKPSDIDIFGPDEDLLKKVALDLALKRSVKAHVTKNAITVASSPRMPIQFITRWCYPKASDLIWSFDYTIAQAAIFMTDGKWASMCSEDFYPDLAARRLTYTFPQRNEDAGGSMMRLRKFLSRGYNIQAPSLAGVIARLMKGIDVKKVNAITGNEKDAAKAITNLLREVDPLIIVDGIDVVDEHEVLSENQPQN
jgi:hypothetical protein